MHKDTVLATVRLPGKDRRRRQETATFDTTARQVELLGDWLASFEVTLVAMEATGVYWKPVVRHEARRYRATWNGRRWSVAAGR